MTQVRREPTEEQRYFADLPIKDVLLVAPAGCGKTEGLAMRAAAICTRGYVVPPRKILALTFSNRAKANLASRIKTAMGPGWQARVTVTNFHGLTARIIRAHAELIRVSRDASFPEKAWRRRATGSLGVNWRNGDEFEASLQRAKRDAIDDDEVMDRLSADGNKLAIAFEEQLRSNNRLDYDDLLRHGARLLSVPDVQRLYVAHFGLIMVDEVQDLTTMQLGIVHSLGSNITYAGDLAQGIYSFAGADPDAVFGAIRARKPEEVEFSRSFRSSPKVLDAVNVLARELGSTELACADPNSWPHPGEVVIIKRNDPDAEAKAVIDLIEKILRDCDEDTSIGVVVRRQTRLRTLKEALQEAGHKFEDWGAPTHVAQVVALFNALLKDAESRSDDPFCQLEDLEAMSRNSLEPSDVEGLDEIAAACEDLRNLMVDGLMLAEAVASCRQALPHDAPVGPGVHLLTGHVGKGQEFDWVVVLGLEDGHVPDFRSATEDELREELRVLHVMISRAKHGLVISYSARIQTASGLRGSEESRWLSLFEGVATSME